MIALTAQASCHTERGGLRASGLPRLSHRLLLWLLLFFGLVASTLASAQPAPPAPVASAPAKNAPPKTAAVPTSSRPGWTELSPAQQDILNPLASSWSALSEGHKRKWLQVAKSYPTLSPEEQAKMQGRMKEWVALSPQQRALARLNFAKTNELSKELTAAEKQAKWQTYQSLSEEEKRKLAAKAPPKPLGAAIAPKPVAPQKLATVPSSPDKPKGKPAPKIAASQPVEGQPAVTPAKAPAAGPGDTPVKAQ